ncbi:MAG: MotA/TolQ/ExbB proton channel family protein [Fibrobacterota bacterium]
MISSIALFFNSGGSFMWVILCVLAVAAAVVVERVIFYFFTCRESGSHLVAGIVKKLNDGDSDGAKTMAHAGRSPLHALLSVAVDRFTGGMAVAEIEEGVQEAAIREMPRLMQRLNYLSLFANIATLLGLIGTISGLQASFSSLASVEASKKAALLAAGIAEAMNCTAFGLITAVPCMVLYTFLYNKQHQISKDLDESLVRFLNYLKKKKSA